MLTDRVREVLRSIAALNSDEKQSLVDFLREQMRIDRETASANSSETIMPSDEPDPMRTREYQWLREHRQDYAGQYVALWEDRLIAHGLDGRGVLRAARSLGFPRSLVVRIEAADELSFAGW